MEATSTRQGYSLKPIAYTYERAVQATNFALSTEKKRTFHVKGTDNSYKRSVLLCKKVRTFVQKGTDFLPKRNAPFRRKTDRNKKIRMCYILIFTFSTIPFFSRCKKNAETTCIHIAVSAFMIVGVVSLLRGLTHQPIYLIQIGRILYILYFGLYGLRPFVVPQWNWLQWNINLPAKAAACI